MTAEPKQSVTVVVHVGDDVGRGVVVVVSVVVVVVAVVVSTIPTIIDLSGIRPTYRHYVCYLNMPADWPMRVVINRHRYPTKLIGTGILLKGPTLEINSSMYNRQHT